MFSTEGCEFSPRWRNRSVAQASNGMRLDILKFYGRGSNRSRAQASDSVRLRVVESYRRRRHGLRSAQSRRGSRGSHGGQIHRRRGDTRN
jgi:hypothetical protein